MTWLVLYWVSRACSKILTLGSGGPIVAFHASGPLQLTYDAIRSLDLVPELDTVSLVKSVCRQVGS